MKTTLALLILATSTLMGNSVNMHKLNNEALKLFGYNPGYEILASNASADHVIIACHGSGANKNIGNLVAQQVSIPVITFNFPDHDMDESSDITKSSFGTIDEYLPLIYILHQTVNCGFEKISLYGFSAGGGAIINALSILKDQSYRVPLERIGITANDIPAIFAALSQGVIILDAPLKSVSEILTIRPDDEFIQFMSKRYKNTGFEPIDRIDRLSGLATHIIVYFEKPDEILANRDDDLFFHKLKAVNNGKTQLITGHDGGHMGFHKKLWAAYKKIQ